MRWRAKLLRVLALTVFFVFFVNFARAASAAPARLGAVSGSNAKTQATNDAAARLGAGPSGSGLGVDLRAVATPRRPTTVTGFAPGALPGDNLGGGTGARAPAVEGKAVFTGDPLPPFVGPEMAGSSLEQVFSIADHAGYTVVKRAFTPNSLDSAYTFDVMSGKARKARVYCDFSLKVLWVEN